MSHNTFTSLFLPGMLQNKKSGGSLSFVIRVSPAGVRFFSLAMIWAGCSPVNGISSLLDVMSTVLDFWAVELTMRGDTALASCVGGGLVDGYVAQV